MLSHIAQLIVFRRYVDDILIFTDEKYFIEFFDHLNKIHPNPLAIHESETNNSLVFLNILVT